MSKSAQLKEIVQRLRENIPEVRGVMIATADGLTIATDFPEESANQVAAMAAAAIGLGKRISQTTNLGKMSESMIKGTDGILVLFMAGGNSVLALQASGGSNLGLIRLEGATAARDIASITLTR